VVVLLRALIEGLDRGVGKRCHYKNPARRRILIPKQIIRMLTNTVDMEIEFDDDHDHYDGIYKGMSSRTWCGKY
jgi:hypothetical protein